MTFVLTSKSSYYGISSSVIMSQHITCPYFPMLGHFVQYWHFITCTFSLPDFCPPRWYDGQIVTCASFYLPRTALVVPEGRSSLESRSTRRGPRAVYRSMATSTPMRSRTGSWRSLGSSGWWVPWNGGGLVLCAPHQYSVWDCGRNINHR